MTFRTLIRRSLRFHARAHVGVVLGAAIGSAALIGALLVGDSVRETLKERALARLGGIHFALNTPGRLFQEALTWRLGAPTAPPGDRMVFRSVAGALGGVRVSLEPAPDRPGPSAARYFLAASGPPLGQPLSPGLRLPGVVAKQEGSARANAVNVFGVDPQTWPREARWEAPAPAWQFSGLVGLGPRLDEVGRRARGLGLGLLKQWSSGDTALINETLARQLAVRPGDEIIVRVRKPSALGLDAVIMPRDQGSAALRLKVGAILPAAMLGDFGLTAQPEPPANLFLPLHLLAQKAGVPGQAGLLVCGPVMEQLKPGRWDAQRRRLADWLRGQAWRSRRRSTGAPQVFLLTDDGSSKGFTLLERAARLLEPKSERAIPDEVALPWLAAQIDHAWLLDDAGLSVRATEQPETLTGGEYVAPGIEVASAGIFLEPLVVAAALHPRTNLLTNHFWFPTPTDTTNDVAFCQFVTNGFGVLTYLANLIRAGDRAAPYSMVTAAGGRLVPTDMRDDEILVNEWLADDLQVKPGDTVALSYYLADSASRLVERTNLFRVRAVVPLKGVYADRTLMPEFPGLAKAESTHDWDTGFPLTHKLREKDETYWKQYRGTPKAFITLAAGQAMWANRFGSLTAIRYDVPTNSLASVYRDAAYRNLLANLNPADVGLRFEAVRQRALKAAAQAQDFGQLFLGFSFFLVVAALLLMALLFQFGLEQRAAEVGTLLALGFTARQVRRLLLAEGATLAFLGGVLGALGGLGYARAMLWGLATVWRGAVGAASLHFHASPASLAVGLCSSTVVAVVTLWLTLRKQARQPIHELLTEGGRGPVVRGTVVHGLAFWVALGAAVGAAAVIGWVLLAGERANAGAFFGAGALLLVSGLALIAAWLGTLARSGRAAQLTVAGLGVLSCARRRGRSLATVALLACGCFVIAAIGVFRLDAKRDATRRASGTGGFALLGQSTMPVVQDLNTRAGRESFGLGAQELAGVNVVPLRVRDGDDASCLNLSRARQPRLLGVKPELLAGRFTFAGAARGRQRREGWELLVESKVQGPRSKVERPAVGGRRSEATVQSQRAEAGPGGAGAASAEVPAIGDANAIEWALGKKLGDTIDYTDEQGRAFKVRLVGAVANSILQGSLVIDEAQFVKRFPNQSGYRMFLIDAPAHSVPDVAATLSRALQDLGLELTPAVERLNAFNAVQNTYLGTFQLLGGLGLLLGSAGLGVVVLRNVLERRGELGLLVAVGFRQQTLQAMVLSEHGALLGLGLGLGLLAAAVAVLPSLLAPGTQLPYHSLALTLGAVLLNGALWTWLATRYALRGNLLDALRNE